MRLSSPFFHHALTTDKVMLIVLGALLPGAFIQTYFFGYGVLINVILCAAYAVTAEIIVLKLRTLNAFEVIKDNSALVTGILIGLAIPPTLPFWMSFIGVTFAIVFAKHLYGGLGYNPFNPAMVGYVLLLISFPVEMTAWLPSREVSANLPNLTDSIILVFTGVDSSGQNVNQLRALADGFTMATPLDHLKTEYTLGKMNSEIALGTHYQENLKGWTWVNLGYLFGGVLLLLTKTIRWQIPLSIIISIAVTSAVLHGWDNEIFGSTQFHLLSGATMIGAFFIATDPVSASTTPKGRIIYGALIGFLVVIIRTFGGYPDAIAFAVLLLNLAAPTIDHYTQPVIYGHKKVESSANE